MSTAFLTESRGHTTIIRLNNPPVHAWTPDSLLALTALVEDLQHNPENRALVITGEGEKFFSAGADLQLFNHDDVEQCERFAQAFTQAFQALANYEGVSIAAINGYAMGGGLEAALSCDIRIAEEHAIMALPECIVGLLPCGLGTQQLTLAVGEQWAKRMILLGEKVDAQKALAIGLVSELVPQGASLEHALALTEKLHQQSPIAVRHCKKLIMGARNETATTLFNEEQRLFMDLFETEDRKEGVQAFLEKRTAQWKNQ